MATSGDDDVFSTKEKLVLVHIIMDSHLASIREKGQTLDKGVNQCNWENVAEMLEEYSSEGNDRAMPPHCQGFYTKKNCQNQYEAASSPIVKTLVIAKGAGVESPLEQIWRELLRVLLDKRLAEIEEERTRIDESLIRNSPSDSAGMCVFEAMAKGLHHEEDATSITSPATSAPAEPVGKKDDVVSNGITSVKIKQEILVEEQEKVDVVAEDANSSSAATRVAAAAPTDLQPVVELIKHKVEPEPEEEEDSTTANVSKEDVNVEVDVTGDEGVTEIQEVEPAAPLPEPPEPVASPATVCKIETPKAVTEQPMMTRSEKTSAAASVGPNRVTRKKAHGCGTSGPPSRRSARVSRRGSFTSVNSEDDLPAAAAGAADSDVSSSVCVSSSLFSDSVPTSPASLTLSEEQEKEKDHQRWKKTIMVAWRSIANHRYANIFLSPVHEKIAAGYKDAVKQPMDLQTLKRNVENGTVRTTAEFEIAALLMFSNALHYNDIGSDISKFTIDMKNDTLEKIRALEDTLESGKEASTSGGGSGDVVKSLRMRVEESNRSRKSASSEPEQIRRKR